jgi:hypothetical protein
VNRSVLVVYCTGVLVNYHPTPLDQPTTRVEHDFQWGFQWDFPIGSSMGFPNRITNRIPTALFNLCAGYTDDGGPVCIYYAYNTWCIYNLRVMPASITVLNRWDIPVPLTSTSLIKIDRRWDRSLCTVSNSLRA